MKHRQLALKRENVLNTDGHAIGIDIGATAVRAAVLAPGTVNGRPSVTVEGLGQVALPHGAVKDGVVHDGEVVTAALKQLWAEQKFNCRTVIVGVASPQALVRDLQMPNLDPARRAKALPYQAKEVIAVPIDELVLDYCQIGEPHPDSDLVDGLLIATPREPVLTAVEAVERAGLRVARVDLSSFAALRAIGDQHLAVEAVVDLGAHLSTIVIHDRGVPKLVRTLARGGEQLTEQLADRLGVERLEAEATKCAGGLESGHAEVTRALLEGLRPLIAEIRTSAAYFRSTHDDSPIERISLTGGGSRLVGIADPIRDQVELPTRVVDPLQHIRDRERSESTIAGLMVPPSAVSVGLAMGAAA
ncbi:type IV pilus assembly protein PilM [Solicola sp. PLA-1-18]|uniref:type IV pilus assembly protein PilM n=1 Tax=Solicola sp. PLA-1-18 TaxID=3380532 RepID=UPI003B795090